MRSKESILKEAIYQETPLKNCIGVVKRFYPDDKFNPVLGRAIELAWARLNVGIYAYCRNDENLPGDEWWFKCLDFEGYAFDLVDAISPETQAENIRIFGVVSRGLTRNMIQGFYLHHKAITAPLRTRKERYKRLIAIRENRIKREESEENNTH